MPEDRKIYVCTCSFDFLSYSFFEVCIGKRDAFLTLELHAKGERKEHVLPERKEPKTKQVPTLVQYSGEPASFSGVYSQHHSPCGLAAALWIAHKQILPACPACGGDAHYRLQKKVKHVGEDKDFQL